MKINFPFRAVFGISLLAATSATNAFAQAPTQTTRTAVAFPDSIIAPSTTANTANASASANMAKPSLQKMPFAFKTQIIGYPTLLVERDMCPRQSMQVGVRIPVALFNSADANNWYIDAEYRFYLQKKSTPLAGFYAAPTLKYNSETLHDDYAEKNYEVYQSVNLGAKTGYQFHLLGRLLFDVWGGQSFALAAYKTADNDPSVSLQRKFSNSNWAWGINLGIAF